MPRLPRFNFNLNSTIKSSNNNLKPTSSSNLIKSILPSSISTTSSSPSIISSLSLPISSVPKPIIRSTTSSFSPFNSFSLRSNSSSFSSPILSLLSSSPSTTPFTSTTISLIGQQQIRSITYGAEYQPSQVRRKRKHGFLNRKRTKNGRKTLERRWGKGRKFLSH